MKATKETFKSIRDLVQKAKTPEATEFVRAFDKLSTERQIVKHLMGLRAAQDKSQADIAKLMGCTQSRVSKFESDNDNNLKLGDLHEYLSALGFDLRLVFVRKNLSIMQAIKLQWRGLTCLLKELLGMCGDDISMHKAVASIHANLADDFIETLTALARMPNGIGRSTTVNSRAIEVLDDELPGQSPARCPDTSDCAVVS